MIKRVSFIVMMMLIGLSLVVVQGCTDADRANMMRYGDSANIEATQWGIVLYEGESTGKLKKKEGGYLFVEKKTGDTIQILGDGISYVIRYKD